MTGIGLKKRHLDLIQKAIARRGNVEKAVLFGSRATGTHKPASDVDIALFGKNLTLDDEAQITSDLEESTLPFKADIIRHDTITSKDLKEHIQKHGKVIYGAGK